MGRENIPKDRTGLQIAADLEEIIYLSKKEINLLNQDTVTMLRNYLSEINYVYKGHDDANDDINDLVNKGTLVDRTENFLNYLDEVK
jgi:hypothetical protein